MHAYFTLPQHTSEAAVCWQWGFGNGCEYSLAVVWQLCCKAVNELMLCRSTSHRLYDSGWDDLQARQSSEIQTLQAYQNWCSN